MLETIRSCFGPEVAEIARHYGADTPFLRPASLAADLSPDIGWVRHALDSLARVGRAWESFSILRPTSPFRQADTIRRAWAEFTAAEGIDSLRAVERLNLPVAPGASRCRGSRDTRAHARRTA